jgi:hypothetical protein
MSARGRRSVITPPPWVSSCRERRRNISEGLRRRPRLTRVGMVSSLPRCHASHWARRFAGARRLFEPTPAAAVDANLRIDRE